MKAMVATAYGSPDVLQLKEVPKPTPGPDEILIRIYYSTVSAGDCEIRRFDIMPLFWLPLRLFTGLFKPRVGILGQEFSGIVESVGINVSRFKPGDAVFGPASLGCGTWADFRVQKETDILTIKPDSISFKDAASYPVAALTALHFLKKAHIKSGENVLIYGSTGSIGSFAVQLAVHFRGKVTAVGPSDKADLLHSIGAERVFDYRTEDFSKSDIRYDVIFDTIGKSSFNKAIQSLTPHGRYLQANPTSTFMVRGVLNNLVSTKKVLFSFEDDRQEDLELIKGLAESGTIRTIIDRMYPIEEMAEAHRYVEKRVKTGHVIVQISENAPE